LNLTDEQKAKLRPILQEQNQQMEALRNDTSMTQEQKVAKANEVRQNASPKIRAILTPEQLQKLADLQQKAKEQQQQSAPPQASQPPHP
jgi:Spy/CpxP family protein refolding chaperone